MIFQSTFNTVWNGKMKWKTVQIDKPESLLKWNVRILKILLLISSYSVECNDFLIFLFDWSLQYQIKLV